jgi:hypothetical protein
MSMFTVRDFIKNDTQYAECAIVSLNLAEDFVTKKNAGYHLELGDEEISYLSDQSNHLVATKDCITKYIEEKKDFIIFDFITKKVYTNATLEDYILRAIVPHGFSYEPIQKEKVKEVLDDVLTSAAPAPAPANLQGKCCCVLL